MPRPNLLAVVLPTLGNGIANENELRGASRLFDSLVEEVLAISPGFIGSRCRVGSRVKGGGWQLLLAQAKGGSGQQGQSNGLADEWIG